MKYMRSSARIWNWHLTGRAAQERERDCRKLMSVSHAQTKMKWSFIATLSLEVSFLATALFLTLFIVLFSVEWTWICQWSFYDFFYLFLLTCLAIYVLLYLFIWARVYSDCAFYVAFSDVKDRTRNGELQFLYIFSILQISPFMQFQRVLRSAPHVRHCWCSLFFTVNLAHYWKQMMYVTRIMSYLLRALQTII